MHVSTGSLFTSAAPRAPLAARRPAASVSRRWLAFLLDMAVSMVLGAASMAALSTILPVDQADSLSVVNNGGMLVGLSHLAWSPALFGTTLGKHVFGLRVVALHGDKPRAALVLARGVVLLLLVPVNAIMVIYGGRHLGDRLADVQVVAGERSLWLALPLALAVFGSSFFAMFPLMRLAVNGAAVTRLARTAAGANEELPLAFTLEETGAEFYLASELGPQHVILRRHDGVWNVVSVEAVAPAAVPIQVRLRSGSEHARKLRIETLVHELVLKNYGVDTSYVRCPAEGLIGTVKCRAGLKEGHEVSFPVEIVGDGWQVKKGAIFVGKPLEAPVGEAIRREYGFAPDSVTCPGLIEGGYRFTCTASVLMQHAQVTVELEVDQEHIKSVSSSALFKPRDLEQRARAAWPASDARVMMPVCLERGYFIPEGGQAQCDTTLDDTVVMFRNEAKGLAVSFRTTR